MLNPRTINVTKQISTEIENKQERKCRYNVTFRRVRVTIVAVEKQ